MTRPYCDRLFLDQVEFSKRNAGLDDALGSIGGAIFRNPTEHRIRLNQVTKWAEHAVVDGPAGIVKRRVGILLGGKNKPTALRANRTSLKTPGDELPLVA
jgi:hypothetical protein